MRQMVEEQIEAESQAFFLSGRLYDDGVIDPARHPDGARHVPVGHRRRTSAPGRRGFLPRAGSGRGAGVAGAGRYGVFRM